MISLISTNIFWVIGKSKRRIATWCPVILYLEGKQKIFAGGSNCVWAKLYFCLCFQKSKPPDFSVWSKPSYFWSYVTILTELLNIRVVYKIKMLVWSKKWKCFPSKDIKIYTGKFSPSISIHQVWSILLSRSVTLRGFLFINEILTFPS